MEEIRLQKYLAEAGIASRRKCEEYITDGRIKVNGKVINELGTKVNPEKDEIFGGNITDRALLSFVQNKKSNVRRVDSIPFDSKNKYAGVKIDNKYKINLVKGAPEKLLDYCKYYVDEFGERKEFKNKDKVKEKIEL